MGRIERSDIPYIPTRVDRWEHKAGRLELKALSYYLAHIILKPFSAAKSKYYKVKLLRTEAKITSIAERAKFKEAFIASGLNFPRSDVMKLRKDVSTAEKQLNRLKEQKAKIEQKIQREVHFEDKPIQTMIKEGICLGISIDVAKRHLVEKEPLESIIPSLEKGGSETAAGVQGIAKIFSTRAIEGSLLPNLYDRIEMLQNAPGAPDALMFDLLDFKLLSAWLLNVTKLPEGAEKSPLMRWIIPLCRTYMESDEFGKGKTFDPIQFLEHAAAQSTNEKFNKTMGAAVTLFDVFSKITGKETSRAYPFPAIDKQRARGDPFISDLFIHQIFSHASYIFKAQALCELNGLSLQPLEGKLGSHLFYKSDAEYLEQLDLLDEGVYMIGINLREGRHAITLVRDKDADYIIDPNGVQLRSTSREQTKKLLRKILKDYDPPKSETKGVMNHRLDFLEYQVSTS